MDDDLRERFEAVDPALLADAADAAVMDAGVEAVGPTGAVGPAVTVRTARGDNRAVHEALTRASAGDVLVVDAGGHAEAAVWGGLLSQSAVAHDVAGVVVDGAVRDVEEIRALDFPVFARDTTPRGCSKRAPGELEVPVSCGGVVVEPGDVVVGDADGVAVVDAEATESAVAAAAEKADREADLDAAVSDGAYLYDLLDVGSGGKN